ncbi:hypothetical protein PF004_g1297 [Phytophthora fragariae]|uniref:Peptidase A2 domain-containing protein n=1 Tax=Phytophthora fragariae TaxID=53985 RepID=A0A6G0PSM5_9STRA|nr:hypothetical protein PF004_g1297 [Phytophthora fragariae]
MEWMVKGEPNKIVNYLIDTLLPEEFRRTIKNEMARGANKLLYKDVVAFIKWLRACCKDYLRWKPANTKKPQPTLLGGKHGDNKKPVVKGLLPSENRRSGDSSSRMTRETYWPLARLRQPKELKLQLPDGSKDTDSTCQVTIDDVLELDRVLLNSGADVNIANRSLVTHLERKGVSKAWFDTFKIYTNAGPLLLRRTPASIFGGDAEPLTMMLFRPVMERLGYSVDAILAKAYGTRPEWDLQDLAPRRVQ